MLGLCLWCIMDNLIALQARRQEIQELSAKASAMIAEGKMRLYSARHSAVRVVPISKEDEVIYMGAHKRSEEVEDA